MCRFSYPALALVATNVGSSAPNLRSHKAIVLPRWCMRVLGRAARELACFGLLRGHTHVHHPHVHVCLPAHSPTKHHSRFFYPSYPFLCFPFFEICVHFFPLLQYTSTALPLLLDKLLLHFSNCLLIPFLVTIVYLFNYTDDRSRWCHFLVGSWLSINLVTYSISHLVICTTMCGGKILPTTNSCNLKLFINYWK